MFNDIITAISSNILTMPLWFFWGLMAFLSGFAVNAFYRMFHWFQHARVIENIPTAKIRSAAQGYVELSGIAKLMDGPVIVSPLTGRSCVWYSYIIEERIDSSRRDGHRNSHWRVVERRRSDALFLLEDETGRCVIDPDDADVYIRHQKTWHKRHVNPPRRYSEQLIRNGDPLYAIGFFKTVADIEQQQTRQQVAHLLKQWKQDPGLLLHRFDHDRNRQLDTDEWEQARKAAENDIKREQGHQTKEEQLNVMMSSDVSDQTYILSSEPEEVLVKQYRWRALKSLGLFFILGSIAVWTFNIRFGL
jgi:hypothetical protein